jgi:hypothetical protein
LSEAQIACTGHKGNVDLWQGVHLKDARSITNTAERLVSNWLPIDSVPARILFYDFKGGISVGMAQKAIQDSLLPVVAFNRGFLSFALHHQLQEYFGPNLPLEVIAERLTDDFLEAGWPDLHIVPGEARAKFTDLARQGLDALFQAKGLHSFEIASGRLAWWPTAARTSLKKLSFSWPDGPSGLRQLVGRSKKRGFHWHYGVGAPVAAASDLGIAKTYERGRWPNNRAKNSHQPTRRRERKIQGFKSVRPAALFSHPARKRHPTHAFCLITGTFRL